MFVLLVAFSVACEGGGPTAPSPVTPVGSRGITITVVSENDDIGIIGVTVTCLVGCDSQQVGTTDDGGQVILTGDAPLTVRAEKQGYVSVEQHVSDGDRIVLQREYTRVTVSVELPYPENANNIRIRVGISEATVTCVVGCEGQQTEVTNHQGEVTFIGRPPLTIRAEKSGHIPVRQQVSAGDRVNMSHEGCVATLAGGGW